MKYIKANWDVVACVAVALIALGLCFWPTLSWDTAKQQELLERFQKVNAAKSLITSIEIYPGGKTLSGATYEDNVLDINRRATQRMKDEAAEVASLAAQQNQVNRVLTPRGGDHEIPLLYGSNGSIHEDNFLPAIVQPADPTGFKRNYELQFPYWIQQMTGGTPPSPVDIAADIKDQLDELKRQQAANARIGVVNDAGAMQLSLREQNLIKRAAVVKNALKIHVYVDDGALQKLPWYGKSVPPTEPEMFEAFVNSWLQQDVVNAIVSLNSKVLDKQVDKNVSHSPVKRLESIVIGTAALGGSNSGANTLFMAPAPSGNSPMSPGGMAMVAEATGIDRSRSLTGHVRSSDPSGGYDVVPMKIVVDIDPAYQNQFIDALYRQNNGYTVLNWNIKAVDPLEAASNGYLYGPTQVVRMEILVEGLLFRSWTQQLMPPAIRHSSE